MVNTGEGQGGNESDDAADFIALVADASLQ